jgi:hypothetical protein
LEHNHPWPLLGKGGETLVLPLSKGKLDGVDYNRDFNSLAGFQFPPLTEGILVTVRAV